MSSYSIPEGQKYIDALRILIKNHGFCIGELMDGVGTGGGGTAFVVVNVDWKEIGGGDRVVAIHIRNGDGSTSELPTWMFRLIRPPRDHEREAMDNVQFGADTQVLDPGASKFENYGGDYGGRPDFHDKPRPSEFVADDMNYRRMKGSTPNHQSVPRPRRHAEPSAPELPADVDQFLQILGFEVGGEDGQA